jgi:hypothetical protein
MFGTPLIMMPRQGHAFSEVDRLAVHRERDIAEDRHVEAGGGDHDVSRDLFAGARVDPCSVNVSMVSVTIEAFPSRSAANRSPSGTTAMRCCHGR